MIYMQMFFAFFQIGLFSFGGGYAAIPLIQSQIVNAHGWLAMSEFADLITIAEMTPGPIAVNAATFVGQRIAGLSGAIICTLGCITPSLIIVLILAALYVKFRNLSQVQNVLAALRPAVVSMIASAACGLFTLAVFNKESFPLDFADFRLIEAVLLAVSLFVLRKWKANPILIIFSSGFIGTCLYLIL